MQEQQSAFDVCVVGGAGHIGAPLAIVMASKGLRTLIYDLNEPALQQLAAGTLPYWEEGGDTLLEKALADDRLAFTSDPADIAGIPYLILTIGTPIDEFHNPRLCVVTDCVDTLFPYLSNQQTLILRSTVFPGVTAYLQRYLEERGKRPKIAFCPERVVQGRAFQEIQSLPQIVSGTTPRAERSACRLFRRIAPKLVRMVPAEAEFAKLICNAYRYIQFAAANQFYMMAERAGLNYARILEGVKQDYPRAATLPGPGFAAGPCLMKDTMQLFAFSNSQFLLGQMAMIVNEGLPNFIVDGLAQRHELRGLTIGILGMAFKADSDDPRESLAYKLGKILRFHGARVCYSDEYIHDPTFIPAEELLAGCEVVIVGAPHSRYRQLDIPERVELIDLWGIIPRPSTPGRPPHPVSSVPKES
jgi:UDP-N-acetyl-D-mannosaminuronic acid dehydrogenase